MEELTEIHNLGKIEYDEHMEAKGNNWCLKIS